MGLNQTISEIAREEIIRFLKEKSKPVTLGDLRAHLLYQIGDIANGNILSNSLHILTKESNPKVVLVERGVYAYDNGSIKNPLDEKIIKILDDAISKINAEAKNIDVFEVTTSDIPKLKEYGKLVQTLENEKQKIKDSQE